MVFHRMLSTLFKRSFTRPSSMLLSKRTSHVWNYRKGAPSAGKNVERMSVGIMALMWWWILWHLFTEYGHITGEFKYPKASEWTDEELGIPPDDYRSPVSVVKPPPKMDEPEVIDVVEAVEEEPEIVEGETGVEEEVTEKKENSEESEDAK